MTHIPTETSKEPYRCIVCSRLMPAGSEMTYISDGSILCWQHDSWEEIVSLTETSSMRTAVCSTCISLKRAESTFRSMMPDSDILRAMRLIPPALLIVMSALAGAVGATLATLLN